MDALLRLLQRAALTVGPDGEDLAQDRQRCLLLRLGADVEAAGARDPLQRILGGAQLEQTLEEEKKTDALLTELAESQANQEAEGEGEESEEEEEAPKRRGRSR